MDSIAGVWQRLSNLPPLLVDAFIALLLTAYMEVQGGLVFEPEGGFAHSPGLTAIASLMTVPLIWRRRYPLLVFCLVLAGIVITFTSGVTAHPAIVWGAITAALIATYSVGAYGRSVARSLMVLVTSATFIVAAFGGGVPGPPDFVIPYGLLILPWLVGHALSTRQLRADAFQERARCLEQEREFATELALAEERARIARELHDVVAHSVSVMVVQAGAARSILQPSEKEASEALRAVEASGREAMTELRHLLGLLSHESEGLALAPPPGIDQLPSLVKRVCDAGLPVDLRVEGAPRPLPPGVDTAAYRIIQEALTNALKYSGLARTEVILDYREAELKVEVLDDGSGERVRGYFPPGRGLLGMRERVALYGGRLEAGPRLERGYGVRAWLPLGGVEQ